MGTETKKISEALNSGQAHERFSAHCARRRALMIPNPSKAGIR